MTTTNKGDFEATVTGNDVDGFQVHAVNTTELVDDETRMYWFLNQDGDLCRERLDDEGLAEASRSYSNNSAACEAARDMVEAAYGDNYKA